MQKRMFAVAFLVACGLLAASGVARAQQHGTKDDAMALVKKAVALVKSAGPEKALAAFNDPAGPFRKGELYVFAQRSGVMVAHTNPKLIGKDQTDAIDPDGQPFNKNLYAKAQAGGGWVDYKYSNPATKKIEAKSSYVEMAGDLMIGCGVYR